MGGNLSRGLVDKYPNFIKGEFTLWLKSLILVDI